jgi:RNA polymerase sigma factor FliA
MDQLTQQLTDFPQTFQLVQSILEPDFILSWELDTKLGVEAASEPAPPFIEERTESEMIAQYLPLVQQIVGGFQRKLPRNVLRDDLLAAGMSGLWDAVRRQLERPSDRFECYVRVRIRGAILDELRAQDWLPRRARAAAAKAEEAGDTSRAVAPAVVRFEDVSEWDQGRCLSTNDEFDSEATLCAKYESRSLAAAVDRLPHRERHIVSAHYFRGVKFKELGLELGVSEPRVSQIHSRAMKLLRDLMDQAA